MIAPNDYRHEVEQALTSSDPISKADYLRWALNGDLPTQARAFALSASAWARIKPEPSMDEHCAFMRDHLLACIETDPPSDDYLHAGWEAGYGLAGWLKHLQGVPGTENVVADVADRMAQLYKRLDASGRNRLETSALEHILERPGLRPYFESWEKDEVLRESYEPALEWGLAHTDEAGWPARNTAVKSEDRKLTRSTD